MGREREAGVVVRDPLARIVDSSTAHRLRGEHVVVAPGGVVLSALHEHEVEVADLLFILLKQLRIEGRVASDKDALRRRFDQETPPEPLVAVAAGPLRVVVGLEEPELDVINLDLFVDVQLGVRNLA